jgi:hypothetical protein
MKATQQLHDLGQSLWLDNITRGLLTGGTLRRHIDELSISGLTSNPSIFDQAIKNSNFYDNAIRLKMKQGKSDEALFFDLAIEDLRQAADLFRPIHDRTNGIDGWVALQCELSTVDTAIFIAGVLTAATYFTGKDEEESEIRELAEILYRRIDWKWALNGGTTISHGWKPESGFLPYRWDTGYSEALMLYVLALGSPTFPIDPEGYREWTSTFEWKKLCDIEYLYAGPLFIHQMSHLWLDFRGIHDDVNRKTGIDYFENSRRATFVQRQYGIENPNGFLHYHKYGWGLTASDGPGPAVLTVNGIRREFFDYIARGAPYGPDDGTISPWAVVASLPFAPEIVIETVRHAIERLNLKGHSPYGFDASFNSTFPDTSRNQHGWVSPWIFGLNQGPIILMIENFQSELIWKTFRECRYILEGVRRAGFRGGWLDDRHP